MVYQVGALVRGHGGANGLVDERDIALVFLDRHLGPNVWGRNQIGAGLIQQQGQFLEPRNDVPDAQWQRRVFEREGGEQRVARSEEHTSELQSLRHLVCRLLLEKKKKEKNKQYVKELGYTL